MLECRGVSKIFRLKDRIVAALRDFDLALPAGSFTVLVGPSGCGKTTALRLLAGLEVPTAGEITRGAGDSSVGYVFQEPRLMPWLSVARNVGFALEGQLPKSEIARRVAEILDVIGLHDFANARPDQLSGGMASRAGLARALVTKPEILLLDEPFAALDAMTRRRLQSELVALWQRFRPTIVFVTHDIEEAVLLGDDVCLMENGVIAERFANPIARLRDPTDPAIVALRRAIIAGFEAGEARKTRTPKETTI
jgi:sulfonate transport system ATP-binding protein